MTPRALTPLAVPFGGMTPLTASAALVARVRMALETRPGRMPWRPEFGCDLAGLAGQPASGATLQLARTRVEAAIRRWVPEAEILRCEVRVVTEVGAQERAGPEIPIAEAALLRLGAATWLEVRVSLRAELGALSITSTLRP